MKQEEKFDYLLGRIIRDDMMEKPSAGFTENVLEKLGVQKVASRIVSKPILSLKSKIAIAAVYMILMVYLFFSGGESASTTNYLNFIPQFKLSALTSMLNFDSQFYTLLVILIGAGWILILFDKFMKRFFLR